MNSGGSTVLIEELPSTGKGRKLLLVGPCLPFQGASWGGRQRVITTWYNGNGTSATQQVLGPTLIPSSWEGVFRRTLMGKTPSLYTDENGEQVQVTSPPFIRDVLESIANSGLLLNVTWTQIRASDERKFEIVRQGRITDFDFPHDRIEDISWKITFDWMGKGANQQKAVALRDSTLGSSFAQLDSYMNELATKIEIDKIKTNKKGINLGASKLTLGQLEALAKAPGEAIKSVTRSLQKNVNNIRRAVDVADKFRTVPYDVANSVTNAARNNVAIANQYADSWSRKPPEANTTKSNASDLLRSYKYLAGTAQNVRDVGDQSQQIQDRFKEQLSTTGSRGESQSNQASSQSKPGSILAVHQVKSGETLMTLSIKYYSSPDSYITIARANKLPPIVRPLQLGRFLIIPALPTNPNVDGYGQ